MVELSQIYEDLSAQHARLIPYPIGFSPAAVIERGGEYGVFVDFERCDTVRQLKGVLAHETGHCATGCTHALSSPWDLVEKHEYKANRWAFERYLPPDELRRAMAGGCTEPWQLAEWFDLPEPEIRRALWYYTQCRGLQFAPPRK